MTDAINTARQISGCENNNTQDFIHAQWRGLNVPSVKLRYPEFEPYVDCLINYLSRNFNSQAEVIAAGGVNNADAKRACLSIFEQNRRIYCTAQVRNNPTAVSPLSDDVQDVQLQRNKDLVVAQAEAKAQKILSDKEEELIAKQNKSIESLKTTLSNIASRGLSDNPLVAAIIQPKIQDVLDKITETAAQFAKERAEKSRNTLANNVKTFTYPMKPLTPQPITPLAEAAPIEAPVIEPLPTI